MRVAVTERRGHGAALAREAVERGADRLLAFGGDGTWNEAVAGWFAADPVARARCVLAPLPAGSGCDFARHLGLPLEPGAAARALAAGAPRRVDAVKATFREGPPRHLTNMAGAGLVADAAGLVERWGKPLGGTASYLAAVVWALLSRPAREYRLTLDGRDASGRYRAVLVANTETTGGGMRAAPGADLEDGLLEVLTVESSSAWGLLPKLARLYDGTHVGQPGVRLRRARTVELEPAGAGAAPLNLDGEPVGALPARFEVLPKALAVLWPASQAS